jgi:hypothetical protein
VLYIRELPDRRENLGKVTERLSGPGAESIQFLWIRQYLSPTMQVAYIRTCPEAGVRTARVVDCYVAESAMKNIAVKQQYIARFVVPAQYVEGFPLIVDRWHLG